MIMIMCILSDVFITVHIQYTHTDLFYLLRITFASMHIPAHTRNSTYPA